MLNKEAQVRVLKALRFEDEAIARLVGEEECDVVVPEDLVIFNARELRGVKEKVKYTYRAAYPEIFGKELNRKLNLGLSVADAKDINKVVQAIRDKA